MKYTNLSKFLIVALCSTFTISPVANAKVHTFKVEGIYANVKSYSSVNARKLFFLKVQKTALDNLINATISKQYQWFLPAINKEKLSSWTQNITIKNGKSDGLSYRATANVTFNLDRYLNDIKDLHIPYTNVTSSRMLLIPILVSRGRIYNNISDSWRKGWYKNKINSGFMNIVTDSNISIDDITKVMNTDPTTIQNLIQKYNATSVILSVTHYDFDRVLSYTTIFNNTGDIVYDRNLQPMFYTNLLNDDVDHRDIDKLKNLIINNIMQYWVNSSRLQNDSGPQFLDVNINNIDLKFWLRFKTILESLNVVTSCSLINIIDRDMKIRINYNGSNEQLMSALKDKKIPIQRIGNKWMINLATLKQS